MSLLPILSLFSGLMLHLSLSALNSHQGVPRKTVPYQSESLMSSHTEQERGDLI